MNDITESPSTNFTALPLLLKNCKEVCWHMLCCLWVCLPKARKKNEVPQETFLCAAYMFSFCMRDLSAGTAACPRQYNEIKHVRLFVRLAILICSNPTWQYVCAQFFFFCPPGT